MKKYIGLLVTCFILMVLAVSNGYAAERWYKLLDNDQYGAYLDTQTFFSNIDKIEITSDSKGFKVKIPNVYEAKCWVKLILKENNTVIIEQQQIKIDDRAKTRVIERKTLQRSVYYDNKYLGDVKSKESLNEVAPDSLFNNIYESIFSYDVLNKEYNKWLNTN